MPTELKNKIVIIATEGLTTNLLCELLELNYDVLQIMLENPESAKKKINRRFKKLSFFNVVSQLMFLAIIHPILKTKSKKRIINLIHENRFQNKSLKKESVVRIETVNDEKIIEQIKSLQPDLIFINGTRIISKKILEKITAPIVNLHVGITPKYRGIHGGYWALFNQDKENFGVTLHYVDKGVDTGKIIAQAKFLPGVNDNFCSYPVLQFIQGLKLIDENKDRLLKSDSNQLNFDETESKQYYHPGFFQYMGMRIKKGVK